MSWLTLGFVAAVLLAATPVLLAALGGALCARVGVFNIALEGQMLWGAFAGVAVSHLTGSAWTGVLSAVLTTAVWGLVLGLATARWDADPIVLAVGMNLLALGLTGFLLPVALGATGTFAPPDLPGLPPLSALAPVPVLGPVLARSSVLVPAALLLAVGLGWWLARTRTGLRLRAVGEHGHAAQTLGISVLRYRILTTAAAGALCGLAGAQLSLGNVRVFTENMTAGRGWIAVAVVMIAAGRPGWVLLTCLLFGTAEALGFRLQGAGAPQQLADAAPYVVTVLVLVLAGVRMRRRRSLAEVTT